MRKQSAQLAKWAAPFTLCALASPKPPADKANVEMTSLFPESCADTSTLLRRTTHEEKSENSLGVNPRDALEQGDLFPALAFQEFLDELRVANWHPKDFQALFTWWQILVTSPATASPFGPSWSTPRCLQLHTTTVPHFGFPW